MGEKYFVKVVRLAVEAMVVEVEADSQEQASVASIQIASRQSDRWLRITDEDEYAIHPVQTWLFDKDEDEDEETVVDYLLDSDDHKFIALFARTDSGEGAVLLEPWLGGHSGLMVADLSGDWIDQIENVRQEGAEDFFDHLEEMAEQARNKSNVINFAEALARRRFRRPDQEA